MEPLCKRSPLSNITDQGRRQKLESVLQGLVLSDESIQKIIDTFEQQIDFANSTDENQRKKSDLFWECTYVQGLLDGKENGDYLGLDLGGTNFRVVLVNFNNGVAETTTKYYNLPNELFTGPAEGVFDHIAISIQKFITDEKVNNGKTIPLGFTFSFPSVQKSLKRSILNTWTKSFKCTTGLGEDPVGMLESAIQRMGGLSVPVDVVARISDTTGTLLAGSYMDRDCRVGLIIGSGSNACYVEHSDNYKKMSPEEKTSDQILVNTEWGALGDNGCLDFYKTEFDKELDQHSNHPGSFTFEKPFSGCYLGELVRLVLLKLANEKLIFGGQTSAELTTKDKFPTSYVTQIESDKEGETANTREILGKLNLEKAADEEDIRTIQETCALISQRGAYIVATGLAVLLHHIDLPSVSVAVDGSVYEHHPKFHGYMMEILDKWAPKTKTKLFLAKDGSGQGAAFVAAVGTR